MKYTGAYENEFTARGEAGLDDERNLPVLVVAAEVAELDHLVAVVLRRVVVRVLLQHPREGAGEYGSKRARDG
jgi:hypothetical protein